MAEWAKGQAVTNTFLRAAQVQRTLAVAAGFQLRTIVAVLHTAETAGLDLARCRFVESHRVDSR